jgi:hypothetical protein
MIHIPFLSEWSRNSALAIPRTMLVWESIAPFTWRIGRSFKTPRPLRGKKDSTDETYQQESSLI